MSRVYISGPMTGMPQLNAAAFCAAAETLDRLGYEPINPGDLTLTVPDPTWADWLRTDLAALVTCDAVAVLPGWQASRGAALEVHVAHTLGMTVLPIEQWEVAA